MNDSFNVTPLVTLLSAYFAFIDSLYFKNSLCLSLVSSITLEDIDIILLLSTFTVIRGKDIEQNVGTHDGV